MCKTLNTQLLLLYKRNSTSLAYTSVTQTAGVVGVGRVGTETMLTRIMNK